jgi:hypothetical protein
MTRVIVKIRSAPHDRDTETTLDVQEVAIDDARMSFRELVKITDQITGRRVDKVIDYYEVIAVWKDKPEPAIGPIT